MAIKIKEIEARLKATLKNEDVNFFAYALDDIAALLAENKRLTAENELLKKSIDLLTPPEHPTVADCASKITEVAGGEDGD